LAAPTNVRVESNSITSATLNWSYSGSNPIDVYRALHGGSYTRITDGSTQVAPGTTTYTDTTAVTATYYDYKLSDDVGSTFSSVVSVTTQACGQPPSQFSDTVLPRSGDQVTSQDFNDLSQRVENNLVRFTDPEGRVCIACVDTNGALVIDCVNYANCDTVQVDVTQDINSISMPNCTNDIKQIDFMIPPSTTRKICGWPGGGGFTGDECFQAPLSGGSAGRTYSVGTSGGKANPTQAGSRPGYPPAARSGGGGSRGGSDCTCVPNGNGGLTIKSCTANNSLGCSGTKSLTLIACGGRTPYTWSHTGSVVLSATTGTKITVTPPTNSGSGVSGVAYEIDGYQCSVVFTGAGNCGSVGVVAVNKSVTYGCNDQVLTCQTGSSIGACSPTVPAITSMPCAGGTGCSFPACNDGGMGDLLTAQCDARTAGMISNGCSPCGLQAGATVSVTDALGVVTTIVLRA